jgi:hypothetical protein
MPLIKRKKKIISPEGDQVEVESNSGTPWENLLEGNIIPIRVTCQDYQPMHRADMSCHTNLPIKIENVLPHLSAEHGSGGGFLFQLRHRPGQKSDLWSGLAEAGVECHDFRCDVCDEQLPLVPRRIVRHVAAHAGKFRSARAGGGFWATLRFDPPETEGDEYQD